MLSIENTREAIERFNEAIRSGEVENIETLMQKAHDNLDAYFNHMIAMRKA